MAVPILESSLTCPVCGHVKTETMPTDACQWYYECEACKTLLKHKPGDCCVYCSYGSVPCTASAGRREILLLHALKTVGPDRARKMLAIGVSAVLRVVRSRRGV